VKDSVGQRLYSMKSARIYLVMATFSAWPIVNFAAANVEENIRVVVFLAFVLANFVMATTAFHIMKRIFRSAAPERIAAAAAIGVAMLYTFRVVREALLSVGAYSQFSLVVTWATIFAILIGGAWAVVSSQKALRGMAGVGVLMMVAAALPGFYGILTTSDSKAIYSENGKKSSPSDAVSHPNVYYLLLDAYARSDEILKMTGFDNKPFLDWLSDKGFTTLPKSRSNYNRTRHAIPSAWIMDYLPGSDDGYVMINEEIWDVMGGNNPTVRAFKEMGYKYIFSGGLEYCGRYADQCIRGVGLLQGAPWALIHSTPIPAFVYFISSKLYATLLTKNNSLPMEVAIKNVSELATSPRFVFYHELAVHRTIYNADCTYRKGLALEEVDRMDHDQQMLNSQKAYVATVQCTNASMKTLISKILTKDEDTIIIIAADHGVSFHSINTADRRENLKNVSYLRELSSTLSSWRLPERCQKWLPDDLSNVNHFRLILACLRNEEPSFLPFKSYLPLTPGSTDSGPVVLVPNSILRDD